MSGKHFTFMIHVSTILQTTKTHFRGWPLVGRAGRGWNASIKLGSMLGTLHGLPRVTVNGISATDKRQRETLSLHLLSSITILTLISTFASSYSLPLASSFLSSQILFQDHIWTFVNIRFFPVPIADRNDGRLYIFGPLPFTPSRGDLGFN